MDAIVVRSIETIKLAEMRLRNLSFIFLPFLLSHISYCFQQLWFPLLDLVLKPQRSAILDDVSFSKRIARHVLNSMIGHMTLSVVLQRIVQVLYNAVRHDYVKFFFIFVTFCLILFKDPAFESGKFGEIKNLLMGMLESYRYEQTLLSTTVNLIGK